MDAARRVRERRVAALANATRLPDGDAQLEALAARGGESIRHRHLAVAPVGECAPGGDVVALADVGHPVAERLVDHAAQGHRSDHVGGRVGPVEGVMVALFDLGLGFGFGLGLGLGFGLGLVLGLGLGLGGVQLKV